MKTKLHISIGFLTLQLIASCGPGQRDAAAVKTPGVEGFITVTPEQFENGNMKLGSFQEKQLSTSVTATGTIDVPPENRAVLSAYHAGYIKSAPFLVGDTVRKGQVLVTLENPEFVQLQQEYLEVAGQMDYLLAEYERQKVLLEEQITSRKGFLQAESNYNSALAKYNGLKKKLQLLHIDVAAAEEGTISTTIPVIAPISGTVSMVAISKGMFVSPSDPILEIINGDHMHLELAVFEKDILRIKKGQPITFEIPEASPHRYKGEVYLVGVSMNTVNRTIKVHGHLEDGTPPGLAVGMFVTADIVTDTETYAVLPDEALVNGDAGTYACLLREEGAGGTLIFEPVLLQTSESSDGYTAITNSSDLPDGARFLTRGAYSLLTGG